MRTIMAVMMLVPALARADGSEAVIAAPERQQVDERGRPYWETCKHVWTRTPYVAFRVDHPLFLPDVTLPSSSSGTAPSGGGSSLGGVGSGGGRPEALLVLAVIALAVLPIIVYAFDDDADPLTLERFYCPELNFSAMGGVHIPTGAGQRINGLGIAKLRADVGYVGGMAELELAPNNGTLAPSFSAHFLLRAKPKAHIEGALALGARRATGPGGTLDGFEVALPHTYVFSRDGYRKLGLELMPRVFWNRRGIDAGADLNVVIPIADVLQLRVGAGAFSHASSTQFTASAGLNAFL